MVIVFPAGNTALSCNDGGDSIIYCHICAAPKKQREEAKHKEMMERQKREEKKEELMRAHEANQRRVERSCEASRDAASEAERRRREAKRTKRFG